MADWIDTTEPLLELMPHAPATFGLDTEFMRISTFFPRLALIQLAFGDRIALIDPAAQIELDALGALLADPARVVVMHSASEDLEALATRFPRGIAQLFDTQIAAAFAGLGAGLGYQKLVREILGVDLPKAETRSDWLRRPLTPQQLEYAAHDVVHLDALHAVLTERVAQRGYTAWLAEDCARLIDRARQREPDPEPQTALRGAADWKTDRQALLRRVLRWREAAARRTDTPRPVAGTHGLVAVAWHRSFEEYAGTQMQNRFEKKTGRIMTERDYTAWLAVRIVGEAVVRTGHNDAASVRAYILSDKFEVAGFKGQGMNFRAWDLQLRQPILLAGPRALVSISPQEGFLHPKYLTDTLGFDEPETKCRLRAETAAKGGK